VSRWESPLTRRAPWDCRSSAHFLYQTEAPGNNYAGQMSADPRRQRLIRVVPGTGFGFYCGQCCSARGEAIRHAERNPFRTIPVWMIRPWRSHGAGLNSVATGKRPRVPVGLEVGFTTLVTIAARFRQTSEAEALLRHIGAISELAGMRYWSTTHKQWQTSIVDAYSDRLAVWSMPRRLHFR
jgi:hypothetical protein